MSKLYDLILILFLASPVSNFGRNNISHERYAAQFVNGLPRLQNKQLEQLPAESYIYAKLQRINVDSHLYLITKKPLSNGNKFYLVTNDEYLVDKYEEIVFARSDSTSTYTAIFNLADNTIELTLELKVKNNIVAYSYKILRTITYNASLLFE